MDGRKPWTAQEIDYLKQHYNCKPAWEIGLDLERSVASIHNKVIKMGLKKSKSWTEEEIEYLFNLDARDTLRKVAKHLNRTEQSVASKMQKLGLSFEEFSTGYTPNYIAQKLNMNPYGMQKYLKRRGVKLTKLVLSKKKRIYQVDGADFWKAVEKHPHDFNLKNYVRMSVLPEPEWLNEAITACKYAPCEQKGWTIKEVQRLIELREKGHTNQEISEVLGRPLYSVKSKYPKVMKELNHG